MNGKRTLWLDQYGIRFWSSTVKELQQQIGGRINKMYIDKKDGSTVHVGYIIGCHWLTAYRAVEVAS